MAIKKQLENRSNNLCELCGKGDTDFTAYVIPPKTDNLVENQVLLCTECSIQIESKNYSNTNYWRCLEGSIWSEVPSVLVLSFKILSHLGSEDWAREAIEAASVDEALIEWARAEDALESEKVIHKDSYGVLLESGDTVILTENLNVKGTNYIAPKGTIVRKIRLVQDNAGHVEGKINGDTIVILTKYIRKSV